MLAKLISIVLSFRRDNLRVEREFKEGPNFTEVIEERTSEIPSFAQVFGAEKPDVVQAASTVLENPNFPPTEDQHIFYNVRRAGDTQAMPSGNLSEGIDEIGEQLSKDGDADGDSPTIILEGLPPTVRSTKDAESHEEDMDKEKMEEESLLSEEEDWEGIEGTELDKAFGKAASFLEKLVLNPSSKIPNDVKLQFYGLYKQATEGPCSSPQPPAYRLSTRAKWNSWKNLGDISLEESMQRYITLLSELCPDWNQATKDKELAESSHNHSAGSSKKALRMGPVFSTLAKETTEQEGLEDLHIRAKEGDLKGVEGLLQSNNPVDQKDSDGRTALHWAADQGHIDIVKLLISQGAQINAKDSDGQTALHYAVTCDWEEIAAFLLERGADPSLTDNDGCTPYEPSSLPDAKNRSGKDNK